MKINTLLTSLSICSLFILPSLANAATAYSFKQDEAGGTVYYNPTAQNQYGFNIIMLNTINGEQFCNEQGRSTQVSGGKVGCHEDESEYSNFDWSSQQWKEKSTGSSNQCYVYYASIKCSSN
ncbi:hypothetical protein ACMZOO_12345 [Catenovulum sp. SX2]|uniref:hypothetical protein n=1 Tax=Catenovulum sp. SX2 TaxID=3398614 RepID=UPI003F87F01F